MATLIYIVFTDKVERNCHFPAPGWNCMTHREALQGFADTSQVSLRTKQSNQLNSFIAVPAGSRQVSCVQLYHCTIPRIAV
jgi:hypothetical protein